MKAHFIFVTSLVFIAGISCNKKNETDPTLDSEGTNPSTEIDSSYGTDSSDESNDTDETIDSDVTPSTDSTQTGETRSFYLAAAPMQYSVKPDNIATVFEFSNFDGQVDLVSLHQDFFGIPWAEFSENKAPPEAWTELMQQLKKQIDALEVGVFLSLTPLSGNRDGAADLATTVDEALNIDNEWHTGCVDFDQPVLGLDLKAGYLAYSRWMVDFFEPKFLNHNVEMNKYHALCPDQFKSLIDLSNQVYEQEKSAQPDLPVFASFELAELWGYGDHGDCPVGDTSCLVQALEEISTIKRDRFGISAYPVFLQWEWETMPEDYFSKVAALTGEKIVFAETGWNNRNVSVRFPTTTDPCFDLLRSSDADQMHYMQTLFEQANQLKSDLVVWWTLRDFLPQTLLESCPCSYDDMWCLLYNKVDEAGLLGAWMMWGGMGFFNHDSTAKPAATLWSTWKNRPVKSDL